MAVPTKNNTKVNLNQAIEVNICHFLDSGKVTDSSNKKRQVD